MLRSAPKSLAPLRREASIALPLGSAVLAAAGAQLAIPSVPAVAWLLTPMLALVGLLAASHGPRQREDPAVIWSALGGALVAVPSAFCAASDPWVCGALFAATPSGLALYAAWLPLLGHLRGLCRATTEEDADLAKIHAGRWLGVVALTGLAVGLVGGNLLTTSLAGVAGALATTRWLSGAIGRHARVRLLEAVRRGEVAGWTIAPREDLPAAPLANLPVLRRDDPRGGVLVETADRGPFRDARVPRALVSGGARPRRWQAPGPIARGSAALVGAVFAPFVGLALGVASANALPAGTPDPGVVVGWTLLVSGPATGLLVGALARLAPPVRSAALALALATYCLGAPLLCAALAAAVRGCGA